MSETLFKRIKDWAVSITAFRTGDVIPVDGPGGTANMSKDSLLKEASQNTLAGNVAPTFDEAVSYVPKTSVVADGRAVTFVTNHSSGAFSAGEVVDWRPEHENAEYVLSKGHYFIDVSSVSEGSPVSFVPTYASSSSASTLRYAVIDAKGINYIKFSGAIGGVSPRLWAFVDSSGNLVKAATANSSAYDGFVIVPGSTKTIVINIREGSFELVRSDSLEKVGYDIEIPGSVGERALLIARAAANYRVFIKKVSAGEIMKIRARGGSTAWPVSFFDSSMTLLAKSSSSVTDGSDIITGGAIFCAPLQSAYLVVNSKESLDGMIEYNEICADCVKCLVSEPLKLYWDTDTVATTVNINSAPYGSVPRRMSVLDVSNLSYVLCYGEGGGAARLWSFLNDSFEIISTANSDARNTYSLLAVPDGAKYFIMQSQYSGACFGLKNSSVPVAIFNELKRMDSLVAESIESTADSNGYMTSNSFVLANFGHHGLCTVVSFIAEQDESVSDNVDFIYVFNGVASRFSLSKCKGKKRFYSFRVPPANIDQLLRIGFYSAGNKKLKISSVSVDYVNGASFAHKGIRFDAHLGVQALAPENTMLAFDLASKCGFEGCIANPIDSADGTFYCYHEEDSVLTLDGTTAISLTASAFRALTDEELAVYKVFGMSWQRPKFLEKIPTLYEFFEMCAITGVKPVLSTHPSPTIDGLGTIKSMTDKLHITDALTIKAFSLTVLENAFEVFGRIEGYVYCLNSVSDISEVISAVKETNFFTAGEKITIEITYSALTQEIADAVLEEKFILCTNEIAVVNYATALEYGVTRFTEKGYNSCNGLSWR